MAEEDVQNIFGGYLSQSHLSHPALMSPLAYFNYNTPRKSKRNPYIILKTVKSIELLLLLYKN
jgi:hypothetical protein